MYDLVAGYDASSEIHMSVASRTLSPIQGKDRPVAKDNERERMPYIQIDSHLWAVIRET